MSEICGSRSSTCYTYLHAIRSTAVAAATRATASQEVAAAVAVAVALAVVGTGAVFFEPWMKVVLVVIVLLVVLLLVIVVLEILVAPVGTSTSFGRNTITGLHKEWVRTFWDQSGKCKLSRLLSRSDPTLGTENWPCHMCASSYAETTAILLYGKEERNRKRQRERERDRERERKAQICRVVCIHIHIYTHTHICICEYIYIYISI